MFGCLWDLIEAEKPYIKLLGRDNFLIGTKTREGEVGTALSSTSRAATGARLHPNARASRAVNRDTIFENMLLVLEQNNHLLFPHFAGPLQNYMI